MFWPLARPSSELTAPSVNLLPRGKFFVWKEHFKSYKCAVKNFFYDSVEIMSLSREASLV